MRNYGVQYDEIMEVEIDIVKQFLSKNLVKRTKHGVSEGQSKIVTILRHCMSRTNQYFYINEFNREYITHIRQQDLVSLGYNVNGCMSIGYSLGHPIEVFDSKAKLSISKRMKQLEIKIKSLEESRALNVLTQKQEATLEDHKQQLKKLKKYFSEGIDFRTGRHKYFQDESQKQVSSFRQSYRRLLKKIQGLNPEVAAFIKEHFKIEYNQVCFRV